MALKRRGLIWGSAVLFVALLFFGQTRQTQRGVYGNPILSPDGRYLFYTFWERERIMKNLGGFAYIMDVVNKKSTEISIRDNQQQMGNRIACATWQASQWIWVAYVQYPDDVILYRVNSETKIAEQIVRIAKTSWFGCSLDPLQSNRLLFSAAPPLSELRDEKPSLHVFDTETHRITKFTETAAGIERAPLWSSDGLFLAYGALDGVHIMDRTGAIRAVVGVHADSFQYAFSPNGNWILSGGGFGGSGLFLTLVADGKYHKVSSEPYPLVSWSSDVVVLATVGVPGENRLLITNAEALGITAFIYQMQTAK